MILEIFEEQERLKAKKEKKENQHNICDLEDILDDIESLIEKLNKSNFEQKNNFIKDLNSWEPHIKAEIEHYEEENLEIMEIWEEDL